MYRKFTAQLQYVFIHAATDPAAPQKTLAQNVSNMLQSDRILGLNEVLESQHSPRTGKRVSLLKIESLSSP